jgi:hypothetical protein
MARLAGMRLRTRYGGWNREPFAASSLSHVSLYELDPEKNLTTAKYSMRMRAARKEKYMVLQSRDKVAFQKKIEWNGAGPSVRLPTTSRPIENRWTLEASGVDSEQRDVVAFVQTL